MKVFILSVLIGFIWGCGNNGFRIPDRSAIDGLVLPVCLQTDTVTISLKNYFSSFEEIKKISLDRGLALEGDINCGEVKLFREDVKKSFFNMRISYKNYNYDLPVIDCGKLVENDSLQILTDRLEGDTIWLKSIFPVADWMVYFENYKLNNKSLFAAKRQLGIVLPLETAACKYARLRVFAIGDTGQIATLPLPIKSGKGFVSYVKTDTLTKIAGGWKEKLREYDALKDSSCNELVQLFAHRISEEFDSKDVVIFSKEDTLNSEEGRLLSVFQNNTALIYGDYIPLRKEKKIFAYLRSYFGKEVIVVSNEKNEPLTLKLDLPEKFRNTDFRSFFGNRFSYDNSKMIIDVPANRAEVIYN